MEERLAGGNAGGAWLVDGTVRRAAGPWTPAVHALLHHLEREGFAGAPRALGVDTQGREVLSHLPGETVGDLVVTAEGFTDLPGRPRRLRILLDAYGWEGTVEEVLDAVAARVAGHVEDLRELAARDPLFARLVDAGTTDHLEQALVELAADRDELVSSAGE